MRSAHESIRVTCPKAGCARLVVSMTNPNLDVAWSPGARLVAPTEGSFKFVDAVVACPKGHRFRVGRGISK